MNGVGSYTGQTDRQTDRRTDRQTLIFIYKRRRKRDYSAESCCGSFSNLFVTSPTLPLILQPIRRFTYVTVHSPSLPLLHLRHHSFSNPSFASPTSQALHLASRPWYWGVTKGIGPNLLLIQKKMAMFRMSPRVTLFKKRSIDQLPRNILYVVFAEHSSLEGIGYKYSFFSHHGARWDLSSYQSSLDIFLFVYSLDLQCVHLSI